ncbi:MAG: WbuC family cupin fold metalloprotein [Bacteroidales bacterium]|nr:WbuC family cupin fold metalloprotein [Bacteroidales bacterium]
MTITQSLLDTLTAQAKASPRLRMNLDLRNFPEDGSQRMLNAIEPGSPLPIHRHAKSSETVAILRGHLREVFYNDAGEVTEVIDLVPGGDCVAVNIPLGQWHSVEVLESGTVILECKDGKYEPLGEEDVLVLRKSCRSGLALPPDEPSMISPAP